MKTICVLLLTVSSLGMCAGGAWARTLEVEAAQATVIRPSETSDEARLLVQFPLPNALGPHSIDFACLSFVADCSGEEEAVSFQAFALNTSWTAQNASWSSPWVNAGGDWDKSSSAYWISETGSGKTLYFDITDFANSWLEDPSQNYGVIVKVSGPFLGTFSWNQQTPKLRILY